MFLLLSEYLKVLIKVCMESRAGMTLFYSGNGLQINVIAGRILHKLNFSLPKQCQPHTKAI